MGMPALCAEIGRVPRGLMHRQIWQFFPWLKYLGLVPGQRHTGKHLLKFGFLVGVLPGGAEEAMYGHEHAYTLHPKWDSRRGFAQVAIDAEVPIVPLFIRNVDEMRWDPILH